MHFLCGLGVSAVNILAGLRWNLARPPPQTRLGACAEANAQLLCAFYSTNSSSQFRAEQSGISGFLREPTNRSEPSVDRTGRQLP
jgi:hypothetical protein